MSGEKARLFKSAYCVVTYNGRPRPKLSTRTFSAASAVSYQSQCKVTICLGSGSLHSAACRQGLSLLIHVPCFGPCRVWRTEGTTECLPMEGAGGIHSLGSLKPFNQQLGNVQPLQSKKGNEHRTWPLWRKPCRLQNGSKKSATGRRCVSHQKSL